MKEHLHSLSDSRYLAEASGVTSVKVELRFEYYK